MTDKAKKARREYHKEWSKRNPDKVKAAQARYWERKAQEAQPAQEVPETQEN